MAREGQIYRYKQLEFWAEAGAIRCIHHGRLKQGLGEEDFFHTITVRDWLERAEAMGREAARAVGQEHTELKNQADLMTLCAMEAIAQGDPLDPKVSAHRRKHKEFRAPFCVVPGQVGTSAGGLLVPGQQPAARPKLTETKPARPPRRLVTPGLR